MPAILAEKNHASELIRRQRSIRDRLFAAFYGGVAGVKDLSISPLLERR